MDPRDPIYYTPPAATQATQDEDEELPLQGRGMQRQQDNLDLTVPRQTKQPDRYDRGTPMQNPAREPRRRRNE